jgi:HlyD family secretion protein
VVSYTAVIDVDNSEGTLTPGATALITIPGAQRADVVRIPNTALTFRPTQEVLEAIGQAPPNLERPSTRAPSEKKGGGKPAYVWRFEGNRFVPVEIVTGLADDRWTELVSGPLQPGQLLVTNATLPRR